MVSGEGAAASNLTHGSMRRGSIAGILRKLGLSHYTKTQVDEKVAAASLAFASGVLPGDVTATYATIAYVDEVVKRLEASIARIDATAITYATRDLVTSTYATNQLVSDTYDLVQTTFVTNETLGGYPTLQVMSDADDAVVASNAAITNLMSSVISEHQTSIETNHTAISELQTAVDTDISEVQSAIETVGDSVLNHRTAIDVMVSRQTQDEGAWDGAKPVNGQYSFASYLADSDISVPTFNWPWMSTPAYEHTYNIFETATTDGSPHVILINNVKNWSQLYGQLCFVSGDVTIGGVPLAIQGEREVKPIPASWFAYRALMELPTDLRGFSIKADEDSTLSQTVMTPYGNLTDNITIKTEFEIDDIEAWTSQMSVAPILNVGSVLYENERSTVSIIATSEWSTPLVPGETFIEVFVNETVATTATPWPNISGYRLVTGTAGQRGERISIEADTLGTKPDTDTGTPYMFQLGVDYPITNPDGTNIRYADVTFRVLDPNFSLHDDGQDTTDTRQYTMTPVLQSSGTVYSHFAIQTLADEEQNYEIGDLIELTGVTGPLGGLEADEINGRQSVFSVVPLENSQLGYAYLTVQLDVACVLDTGEITGVSWDPPPP